MIRLLNLKNLDAFQINNVKDLTNKFYEKIKRTFKNPSLILNIKKYDKDGSKSKYSVHLKLEDPSLRHNILSAKQSDWNLSTALHKTFNNLKNQITHKLKIGVTPKKKKRFI